MNNVVKLHSSGAHIWAVNGGCTANPSMSAQIPRRENPDADAGTLAHKIAAGMIDKYLRASRPLRDDAEYTTIPDEMFEAADAYAQNVRDISRSTRIAGGDYVGIEKPLPCPEIAESMVCIPDSFIFNRDARHLFLWEFKYGHTPVEVFENPQIICNLSAIASHFKIGGYEDQKITVHATVIQPRCFHSDGIIRKWDFPLSDIRAHINIFKGNGEEALGTYALAHSGSHCKDCSARYTCKTALTTGISLYEYVDKPKIETMTDEALGLFYSLILRAQEQIKCIESGIGEEVKARLKRGLHVPGFSLEQAAGRLKWSRPAEEIARMAAYYKFNVRKETEVITPTQAQSLGLPASFIEHNSKRELSGFKIVPVNLKKSRSIFQ